MLAAMAVRRQGGELPRCGSPRGARSGRGRAAGAALTGDVAQPGGEVGDVEGLVEALHGVAHGGVPAAPAVVVVAPGDRVVGAHAAAVVGGLVDGGDRKSTRLNSSHVRISYAVFCLK